MRRALVALTLIALLPTIGASSSTEVAASSADCGGLGALLVTDCGRAEMLASVQAHACALEAGRLVCEFDVALMASGGGAPTPARLAGAVGEGIRWGGRDEFSARAVCETIVQEEGSCVGSETLRLGILSGTEQYLVLAAFLDSGAPVATLMRVQALACLTIEGAAIGAAPTLTPRPCP